jgi:hypothetical protein
LASVRANRYSEAWLENARRRSVPAAVLAEIARGQAITTESFAILGQA